MVKILSGLSLRPQRQGRLLPFQLLAALIMAISVVGYASAAALFLNRVGAEAIPAFYLVLGLISLPVSLSFYRLIDAVSRLWLMRWAMVGTLLLVLGLRLLLGWEGTIVGYAVYVSLNLVDLLLGVLFWTLVSDYFNPLELERYTPLLAIAMTFGGLVAGGMVRLLSELLRTENLLLLVPLLCCVAIAQLWWLKHPQLAIADKSAGTEADLLPNLRNFPRLARRYPLIVLMAAQMALAVMLWGLSERQFFSIYTQAFPSQEDLTGFLGMLSAGFSMVEVVVSYYFTRPLIQAWGIDRMNLVYPLTTLVSFIGLTLGFGLPSAVIANLNYDALNNSIAQPIQNLNFNAIPRRFSGRARVVIDGLLYPAYQAIAGILLLLLQTLLNEWQLSMLGVGLSTAFLSVSYLTGKSYVQSMLAQLRAGLIDLNAVGQGLVQLSDDYANEVRELLISDDPVAQELGLEVAARLANPSQFLLTVQKLLLRANPTVQGAIVQFFAQGQQPEFQRYLRVQLVSEHESVRAAVLETLIATQQPFSATQLNFFLEDASPLVRALACVATQQAHSQQPEVLAAYDRTWSFLGALPNQIDIDIRQRMLRTINRTGDRQFIPLIRQILVSESVDVREIGLETLASLAVSTDTDLVALATIELSHANPRVRAAALMLLRVLRSEETLIMVVTSLEDKHPAVRRQAANAIAAYGDSALSLVQGYLNARQREVQAAAIAAIGQIRSRRAEDLLWQHLQPNYQMATCTLKWLQQLPANLPHWQMLAIALQDFHAQSIHQVLYVLACLGYGAVVERIELHLYSPDDTERQQAVTTLTSLGHRRFIQPLLPLLEFLANTGWWQPSPQFNQLPPATLLSEMLEIGDRWIRIGALTALVASGEPVPAVSIAHPDPITQQAAKAIAIALIQQYPLEDLPLSRIFFLKRVPFFKDVPLDELLLIDRNLQKKDFLSGEIVFQEGSWGEELYIIYRGKIQILKRVKRKHLFASELLQTIDDETYRELPQLQVGDYFGDLTLFDDLPRAATAIAQTDCTLLAIKRSSFQALISDRPEIALRMCREMSLRLRETNRYLE